MSRESAHDGSYLKTHLSEEGGLYFIPAPTGLISSRKSVTTYPKRPNYFFRYTKTTHTVRPSKPAAARCFVARHIKPFFWIIYKNYTSYDNQRESNAHITFSNNNRCCVPSKVKLKWSPTFFSLSNHIGKQ